MQALHNDSLLDTRWWILCQGDLHSKVSNSISVLNSALNFVDHCSSAVCLESGNTGLHSALPTAVLKDMHSTSLMVKPHWLRLAVLRSVRCCLYAIGWVVSAFCSERDSDKCAWKTENTECFIKI